MTACPKLKKILNKESNMSSARNHAKRSHRSERYKKSAFSAHARKVHVRQINKPKKATFFSKLARVFHRKNAEA